MILPWFHVVTTAVSQIKLAGETSKVTVTTDFVKIKTSEYICIFQGAPTEYIKDDLKLLH